jgi:hypothetical protein
VVWGWAKPYPQNRGMWCVCVCVATETNSACCLPLCVCVCVCVCADVLTAVYEGTTVVMSSILIGTKTPALSTTFFFPYTTWWFTHTQQTEQPGGSNSLDGVVCSISFSLLLHPTTHRSPVVHLIYIHSCSLRITLKLSSR